MDAVREIELFTRLRHEAAAFKPRLSLAAFVDLPHATGFKNGDCHLSAAQLHLRELANFVNEYTVHLNDLRVWDAILPSLPDDERWEAVVKFVHPSAYLCLGFPHRLKSRANYAIAAVSHLANEFVDDGWTFIEELGNSKYETARLHAQRWGSWPSLRHALGRVNNKPFREATANFRNEYEHGLPRGLEIGVQPFVRRMPPENGGLSVVVGAVPPLRLANLLPPLLEQHAAAINLHKAFVVLVQEQLAACDG